MLVLGTLIQMPNKRLATRQFCICSFCSQVKVLYVRNLTQLTSEEMLKETFEQYGVVERVKKIKDYAFVHYDERDDAVKVRCSN